MIEKAKHTLMEETLAEKKLTNPDKVLVMDADTLAYAVCSVCEYGDEESGYQIDMDYALKTGIEKAELIRISSGCGSVELHFTKGKNFRYTVDPNYKSNRIDSRTPCGLSELKDLLVKEFEGSLIHTDIEADDYVVWRKKFYGDLVILGAVDKDVLFSVAGEHYNYYQNEKYNIKPSFVTIDKNTVLPWFYLQILMGDQGDGIQGIPKCGPVKAFEILAPELGSEFKALKDEYKFEKGKAPTDILKQILIGKGLINKMCQDNSVMFERALKGYTDAGLTETDLIRTARLVSMHQLDKEGNLSLWTQPV